ncbi:MAG: ABC transporter permease [Acidimicrobiia bacterium]|jgi:putative ABC transport system permease protein|nr:ABC transporter permease [Acidimicrobiia bacterium]MBP8181533.1 ABC transporter permease [Acidimicrobiia bacterium]
MDESVGWLGVSVSGSVLIAAIVLARWAKLGNERSLAWSSLRAFVQLLVVAAALGLVISPDTPVIFAAVWAIAMAAMAGDNLARRSDGPPGLGWVAFFCLVVCAAGGLVPMFLSGALPFTGRSLVPLSGMLIGNSMNSSVLSARGMVRASLKERPQIEAMLALGFSGPEAIAPTVRRVVREALVPMVETTRTMGVIFLPGATVGMVLAGADALAAIQLQVSVVFLILATAIVSSLVIARWLAAKAITPDYRLVPLTDAHHNN